MKKSKLLIWIPIVAVILIGALAAGYFLMPEPEKETVYVYPVNGMIGMTGYFPSSSESYGMVTTDRVQTVFLSQTQTVKEILVTDGQQVKKGDVLFTYDTTLSELALERAELGIMQQKLELDRMYEQLRVINCYVPISTHPVEPTEPKEPPKIVIDMEKGYNFYAGDGTTSDPYLCWLRGDTLPDVAWAKALLGEDDGPIYIVFQHTADDKEEGEVTDLCGIMFGYVLEEPEEPLASEPTAPAPSEPAAPSAPSDPTEPTVPEIRKVFRLSFFDPNTLDPGEPPDDGIDWNSGFYWYEIAEMRDAQEELIKQQEFAIKMAESELSIMRKEADNGEVTADFDGIVTNVLDPEMSALMREPLMKISGGGGYYVEGTVSELDLATIQIGMNVTVTSWDTWQTYNGVISSIGDYPQENGNHYSEYGNNVSYYPYKVFIDASADLADGYYVSMVLEQPEIQGTGLYVETPFILNEGGKSYVYVRNASGLLEKRSVQTGANLWGSYVEIRGGIDENAFIAFPYGRAVQDGAPTAQGDYSTLYGY